MVAQDAIDPSLLVRVVPPFVVLAFVAVGVALVRVAFVAQDVALQLCSESLALRVAF